MRKNLSLLTSRSNSLAISLLLVIITFIQTSRSQLQYLRPQNHPFNYLSPFSGYNNMGQRFKRYSTVDGGGSCDCRCYTSGDETENRYVGQSYATILLNINKKKKEEEAKRAKEQQEQEHYERSYDGSESRGNWNQDPSKYAGASYGGGWNKQGSAPATGPDAQVHPVESGGYPIGGAGEYHLEGGVDPMTANNIIAKGGMEKKREAYPNAEHSNGFKNKRSEGPDAEISSVFDKGGEPSFDLNL